MPTELILLLSQFPEDALHVIDHLFQEPANAEDERWYPTTDTFSDPDTFEALGRRIDDDVLKLRTQDELDLTK